MDNSTLTHVFNSNEALVEELFAQYQKDPNSVTPEWRAYFQGYNEGFDAATQITDSAPQLEALLAKLGTQPTNNGAAAAPVVTTTTSPSFATEQKAMRLVQGYKQFGHLKAKLDPLGRPRRPSANLELNNFGITDNDLKQVTHAGVELGIDSTTLGNLVQKLEERFCGSFGVEFEHMPQPHEREWLYNRMDGIRKSVDRDTQTSIYKELVNADALEKTLATKYIGKKRFSIEGSDAQIPALESFIDAAAKLGAKEFCFGMAHRGRLTILVQVVKRPLEQLMAEFEGYPSENFKGDGDVKYHGGYDADRTTRSGLPVHVSMSFNPSHLEFVDSVTIGEARAKQLRFHDGDKSKVIPILLHGDAAVSGQGCVYETAQMMSLRGYDVGGSIHIVANNQVGFTTNPYDARTSEYPTDVAKVSGSPIFHVNGEDFEAVNNILSLAAEYRQTFFKDVYINIVCFRRHGHNEGDEPTFTQPAMYKIVKTKPSPYETYRERLVGLNSGFNTEELNKVYTDARAAMNVVYDKVKNEHIMVEPRNPSRGWESFIKNARETELLKPIKTGVSHASLKSAANAICNVSTDIHVHSKIQQIVVAARRDMADEKSAIDWGMAEMMAYATLLQQGFSVRVSGQDCGRGTFAHRHAALVDVETDEHHFPLDALAKANHANFDVIDSFLSETAVMGFEYGYAARHEKSLTIWEAQFGDFANGAQVIIDNFIVSGETKWAQPQGLVLLLPHGAEGQGPEHSSARIERFLQMCGQGNMTVCYLTSAANLFHVLRRQVVRDFRKPLVIMSPKSYLRNPRVATNFAELEKSQFNEIFDDEVKDSSGIKTVVMCAGKLAIELLDARENKIYTDASKSVALVRIDQIYPLASDKLVSILKRYKNAEQFVWAQEEPKNMGAYLHLKAGLESCLRDAGIKHSLQYRGRCARASQAVGFDKIHLKEQETLINAVFTKKDSIEI